MSDDSFPDVTKSRIHTVSFVPRMASPFGLLVLVLLLAFSSPVVEPDDLEARVDLCIITISVDALFREVHVAADLEFTNDEMAALLDEVDFDDDGHITRGEVLMHEAESEWTETQPQALAEKRLKMDGQDADEVRFRTWLRGFEGPIADERGRLVTENRSHLYGATEAAERHTLDGGYPQGATIVEEFVIFEAPDGWVVQSVNGEEHGTPRVELPAFGTRDPFTVVYDWAPSEETVPAPAGFSVALAIALLLLIAGRSR